MPDGESAAAPERIPLWMAVDGELASEGWMRRHAGRAGGVHAASGGRRLKVSGLEDPGGVSSYHRAENDMGSSAGRSRRYGREREARCGRICP